ncbi:uncharacterized protein METZ01_LOCUS187469 [marine metagenome]|uniref:Uncharacterized protein n=1 Tax=marine metagenome TaxID=408172 RepID=A0A382D8M7_9ZZZZ
MNKWIKKRNIIRPKKTKGHLAAYSRKVKNDIIEGELYV